jgi:predicted peroxiredoxin
MAEDGRVVVGCSRGEENPDSVAVSYLTAGAALDQGRDVVLWLTSEGVRLGISGYADGIRVDQDPPVARLHQQSGSAPRSHRSRRALSSTGARATAATAATTTRLR